MAPEQSFKQQAAEQVLAYIQSGTVVGLGHGSTAILAVRALARKLDRGELTGIAVTTDGDVLTTNYVAVLAGATTSGATTGDRS